MAYTVPSNPEFAIRSGDGQIEFLAPPEPIEVVQNCGAGNMRPGILFALWTMNVGARLVR